MRSSVLLSVTTCAVLLMSEPASAQEFYRKGKISVALERGFGIHYVHQNIDPPGPGDAEFDGTAFGFGWYAPRTPLHQARAAIDGFIIDQLSLGGSLAFFTHSGDGDDSSGLLLSPRVGYAVPISRAFTFWPRGGLTFYDLNDPDISLFALSGEAMFVASPTPNWGILFGATLDFGFTGDAGDNDFTEFSFGIPVGILGTF